MREFELLLQKRAYWCSLFALLSLLMVAAAWRFGYQDIYKKRIALVARYAELHNQAKGYESSAKVSSSMQVAVHEVSEIKEKLDYHSEVRNSAEIVPYVVKLLDSISVKYGIQLKGVRPLIPEVVLMLEERPFDITISGSYQNLFKWVVEAESLLSPMAIKSFQLHPNRNGSGVEMRVRVVSYSLPGDV